MLSAERFSDRAWNYFSFQTIYMALYCTARCWTVTSGQSSDRQTSSWLASSAFLSGQLWQGCLKWRWGNSGMTGCLNFSDGLLSCGSCLMTGFWNIVCVVVLGGFGVSRLHVVCTILKETTLIFYKLLFQDGGSTNKSRNRFPRGTKLHNVLIWWKNIMHSHHEKFRLFFVIVLGTKFLGYIYVSSSVEPSFCINTTAWPNVEKSVLLWTIRVFHQGILVK